METNVQMESVKDTTNSNKKSSRFREAAKSLVQSKLGFTGFIIVFIAIMVAICAPLLSPHDPAFIDTANANIPPVWLEGGSSTNLLGTDNLGRDVLSRVIYGTQISLLVGALAVVVAGAIGLVLGLIAGYYGGFIDNVLMRIVDAFLAIPNILFMLVILGIFGPSLVTLIVVLGVTNWIMYARLVRGEVLSVKELDYVMASRSIGTKNFKIILKHIMPNVFSSFIVISTLSVASIIILEASLSFLGLGVQPPTVSWGGMLSEGRDYLATSWWIATFPGIAITITVLGIIFLGDWLRDLLDPRSVE